MRPANWWDDVGFGHQDAYANADPTAYSYRDENGAELFQTVRLEPKKFITPKKKASNSCS